MDADKPASDEFDHFDDPIEVDPHVDRTKENKVPNFQRMNTDWNGPNADNVRDLVLMAENEIMLRFPDVFSLMNDLYDIVREHEYDRQTGELVKDRYGWPVWKKNRYGVPFEDWNKLTQRQRENFMMRISTNIVEWDQKAQNSWGEAMFAKAHYEEVFAEGFAQYSGAGKSTVDSRTNGGRLHAATDRYRGIYYTLVSRKCDALVRSMERLSQRLKDIYVA